MPLVNRLILCLLLSTALPALADETIIYRCTGADGSLALQSMPCPKGSQQEVRRLSADYAPPVLALPTTPAPVQPQALTPAPAAPGQAIETAEAPEKPLPPLHHCQPRRGAPYYTDDLAESVRCLSLRVTGLDGNPATGAGEACEVQRDTCEVVAAGRTCQAWQDYLQQSRQRFAGSSLRDSQSADVRSARIAAMIAASACAAADGDIAQNP